MKKGTIYEGIVRCVKFPNKGVVSVENGEQEVSVKYAIPGQKVKILVNKVRKGKAEGASWRCWKHRRRKCNPHVRISGCVEAVHTRVFHTKNSWN